MTAQNKEMAKELRGLLGIDQIRDADDTVYKEISVPEWGGTIRFGTLSAGVMLEHVKANEGPAKFTAGLRMIIESLVDETGRRIGDPSKHLEIFKKKNTVVINRIGDEILKLNGWGKKPLDFTARFVAAGNDPEQLKALVDELTAVAQQILEAGADKEKLKAIAEGKEEAEAKNASGGTP